MSQCRESVLYTDSFIYHKNTLDFIRDPSLLTCACDPCSNKALFACACKTSTYVYAIGTIVAVVCSFLTFINIWQWISQKCLFIKTVVEWYLLRIKIVEQKHIELVTEMRISFYYDLFYFYQIKRLSPDLPLQSCPNVVYPDLQRHS